MKKSNMKQNELFKKCTSNVNPETRTEVERNMALSKEFWKEWRNAEIPAPIDAILWGMRKQKQIDIERADKWLRVHLPRVIENYPRSNGTTDMLNEDMRAEFREDMEQ